ncbi:hypothetical protein QRD43_17705 [Pelomonas sp. APW6]|uniref:Transmembrane protein n=1 Tax=Roseateles subflavus TaxID=3053353 RepID=A0ABT7LLL4_9BURK|nr:hypothetical protein [Pelomonas sp. APW6]MDL5033751.1 hypothetical protein [Pelomonas sp. APW6]
MGLIGEKPGPARWAMHILWPAFVMAGVTEALVFTLVDPMDLSWFGAAPVQLSREAVYTLAFMAFWVLISLASSMTLLLARLPADAVPGHPRRWPQ